MKMSVIRKYNQYHMTWEGLSDVFAKVEPANCKMMKYKSKCPAKIYSPCSFSRYIYRI